MKTFRFLDTKKVLQTLIDPGAAPGTFFLTL